MRLCIHSKKAIVYEDRNELKERLHGTDGEEIRYTVQFVFLDATRLLICNKSVLKYVIGNFVTTLMYRLRIKYFFCCVNASINSLE
ncbi:unnamed protein product, partial [Urochloa humidicola]